MFKKKISKKEGYGGREENETVDTEGVDEGKGSRANIIINQHRSDVNVKLPEPIWSCITRGVEIRLWTGSKGGRARGMPGWKRWPIVRVICHAAYESMGFDDPVPARSYWPIIDGYSLY